MTKRKQSTLRLRFRNVPFIRVFFDTRMIILMCIVMGTGNLFAQQDSLLTVIKNIRVPVKKLSAILSAFPDIRSKNAIQSFEVLNEGVKIAQSLRDMKAQAHLYLVIGMQWQSIGNFAKASENYFLSLNTYRVLADTKNEIFALRKLGDNFRASIQYNESMIYLHEAYHKAISINDSVQIMKTCNRMAATLFEMLSSYAFDSTKQLPSASLYFKDRRSGLWIYKTLYDSTMQLTRKALHLAENLHDKMLTISTINIIGALYNFTTENADSSRLSFERGIELAKGLNAHDELVILYRNLAGYYTNEKQLVKALEMAKLSYKHATLDGNKILMRMATEVVAAQCRDLKLYKEQAHYLEIAYALNLNLYDADTRSRMLLQKAEFEDLKNAQILASEKKQKIIILVALLGILITFTIFTLILIRRNRVISRTNEALNEKNQVIEQQRDELDKTNKSKDRFFSIIAHDLKSPFTGLLGYSKVLNAEYPNMSKEEIGDGLAVLQKSVDSLYNLTVNLLNWAELQSDKAKHNPISFDLTVYIKNLLDAFYINAKSKEITIENELQEQILVFADPDEMRSVVHNLLSNALKFTPRGGKITVRCEKSDLWYTVHIEDSGVGIPKNKIQELFELDKSSSTHGTEGERGTGLGLLICKEMIEKNEGKMFIASTLGKGSIFSFTLPLKTRNSLFSVS